MIDYHVHSMHSGDSPCSIREMCARAVEIGITEIAFTEHLDFLPTDISFGALVYPRWLADIESARTEFSGQLTIRSGVEVDYQPQFHTQIERFLSLFPIDFALGSTHYVDGVTMEDHERFFGPKTETEAYTSYFEMALATVASGLFDSIGHFDLCKRYGTLHYGPFRSEKYRVEIEKVLKAVVERDLLIEINTSGLRQPPGEPYPSLETLKMYRELGGRVVTIGSDSHTTEQLGFGLNEGLSLLKQAGIDQIARFEGRACLAVAIDELI